MIIIPARIFIAIWIAVAICAILAALARILGKLVRLTALTADRFRFSGPRLILSVEGYTLPRLFEASAYSRTSRGGAGSWPEIFLARLARRHLLTQQ